MTGEKTSWFVGSPPTNPLLARLVGSRGGRGSTCIHSALGNSSASQRIFKRKSRDSKIPHVIGALESPVSLVVVKGVLTMNWMSNAKTRVSRAAQGRGKQRGGLIARGDHAREDLGAAKRGAVHPQVLCFPQLESMATSMTGAAYQGGASADVAMLATESRSSSGREMAVDSMCSVSCAVAHAEEDVLELVLFNDGHSVFEDGGHVAASAQKASPTRDEACGQPLFPPPSPLLTDFVGGFSTTYHIAVHQEEEEKVDKTPARSWLDDIFNGALLEGGSSSPCRHAEPIKRKLPPDWSDED